MGESGFDDLDDGGDHDSDSDGEPARLPIEPPRRSKRFAQRDASEVVQEVPAPALAEGVRRSVRNAKPPEELGYTPEDIEYNENGDKVAFDRSKYIGSKFNPARFKEGDFAEGNMKGRSIQDNTARNYANYLFQTEHEGPVSIDKEDTNPHKDTFTNHLLRVYQKYGINRSIMKRRTGIRADFKVD